MPEWILPSAMAFTAGLWTQNFLWMFLDWRYRVRRVESEEERLDRLYKEDAIARHGGLPPGCGAGWYPTKRHRGPIVPPPPPKFGR